MSKQPSEDRSPSCAFTYSDGRHCRMLRSPGKSVYCYYHDRKLHPLREPDPTASQISAPFVGDFVPASALTHSLTRVFCALAEGRIDPKQATALSRVGTTLLKSICESSREFEACCNDKYWNQLIWSHYKDTPDFTPDDEDED